MAERRDSVQIVWQFEKTETTEHLIFFFSHLVAFLSPGIGYKAVVFQECKICTFDESNALVLSAKCKIK